MNINIDEYQSSVNVHWHLADYSVSKWIDRFCPSVWRAYGSDEVGNEWEAEVIF